MGTFIAGFCVGIIATMAVLCFTGVIYVDDDEEESDDEQE